ncbi:MAG: hypothetical protein HY376_02085 [Candidatus Blackburnbacteria bacterium]|nr:hypothetical protein [Candidatus Blackburnbacteria bacterium]
MREYSITVRLLSNEEFEKKAREFYIDGVVKTTIGSFPLSYPLSWLNIFEVGNVVYVREGYRYLLRGIAHEAGHVMGLEHTFIGTMAPGWPLRFGWK